MNKKKKVRDLRLEWEMGEEEGKKEFKRREELKNLRKRNPSLRQ